ncbi:MAG: acyl-ACP--UDP-N-acetylglucosamine O-acyltransferase [Phycisphaerales bacterium]|jgi:UDP-N-acetylglucosamine acyltransferase|nr:acyl-ACP--UDP-N-acetylglucosamine O-acyltransferase [Phycisphaerales bacterium]
MTQIHPTAIVSDEVELGNGVEIGPFCILTGRVKLGDGVKLIARVSIQGPVEIGTNTVVYPNASIGFEPQDYKFAPGSLTAGVVVGSDSILRESVTIHSASNDHTPTKIGNRVMMMIGSHAGHDSTVCDDVIMVNSTHLGGHSLLQDRVIFAGGSMLHQFCRVGRQAMTSGCTVLTGDLPPFCMAVGRNTIVGLNMVGMRRSGMAREEIDAVRFAYKTVLRKNPPMPVMKEMLAELGARSPSVKLMSDFIAEAKRPIAPVGGRRVS